MLISPTKEPEDLLFPELPFHQEKGIIEEKGLVSEIFKNPRKSYTKTLINSSPKNKLISKQSSQDIILHVSNLNISYNTSKSFFGFSKKEFKAVKELSFYLIKGET